MFPGTKNRRAHSPKLPFYETALLFPLDYPDLPFLAFSVVKKKKKQGKSPKGKDYFSPPNPKSPGQEDEDARKKKEFLANVNI